MSQSFSCRPSELYGITGDYRRYCFDSAVWIFGVALENELEGVTGKNQNDIERKRIQILRRWIPPTGDDKTKATGFRDPGRG